MQGPDPDLIKEACKAELGRGRQEELPLSNNAKRPTYLPRGLGTSHIPEARKDRLENKWSIKIVDEESLQMEGLEIGDSRPYAQFTNQYMARHAFSSAPPRIAMAAGQARPSTVPKPPSSVKPAASVKPVSSIRHASSMKPASTLKPAGRVTAPPVQPIVPVSQKVAPRSVSQVGASPQVQGGRTNLPVKTANQPNATPASSEQAILSQGECEIINESDNSSIPARFVAKVHVQKNEGTLVLMPSGKTELAYNVLNLGKPAIQGPFCIIFNAKGERLHKVKMRTAASAESFQYLLKCLLESAQKFGGPKPMSPKPAPIPAQKQQENRLQTPSKAILDTPKAVSKATNGHASTALQTSGPIDASLQPKSEASLLNLEEKSHPKPSLTIDAAADHMQYIVQQILTEITATGVQVPEQGVEEIESTAIANWMAQGFMQTETESAELKEELMDLLRLLVRIKRKVQYRHGGHAESKSVPISKATMQDLQEIVEKPSKENVEKPRKDIVEKPRKDIVEKPRKEIVEQPSKRIKYTPADIKQLESHAVSRKDNIKASGLLEIQNGSSSTVSARKKLHKSSPSATDVPKKMVVPIKLSDSGSKATVELTSSGPKAANGVPKSGTKTNGGLATSRWATSDGWSTPTNAAAAKTEPAAPPLIVTVPTTNGQKPKPKGLSSSRWAN